MLMMSKAVCQPINPAHSKSDNSVKIMSINCNCSTALCDNCDQSIIEYGPGEVLIKS